MRIHVWHVLFQEQPFYLLFVNCYAPVKPGHFVYEPVGKAKCKTPGLSHTDGGCGNWQTCFGKWFLAASTKTEDGHNHGPH